MGDIRGASAQLEIVELLHER